MMPCTRWSCLLVRVFRDDLMFTVEHNNGIAAADVQKWSRGPTRAPFTRVECSRIQLPVLVLIGIEPRERRPGLLTGTYRARSLPSRMPMVSEVEAAGRTKQTAMTIC